jgi:ketosteroid isomerase-like protein
MLPIPRRATIVSLLFGCLVLAFTLNPFAQGSRDATLNQIAEEFAAAFTARDAAKIASFYADDAIVMPPSQPMVRGRENIEAYFRNGFAQGGGTLRLQPMESSILGSRGFEVGTSSLVMGPTAESAGKYVVIYERVGNDWKISYDIFNNDAR